MIASRLYALNLLLYWIKGQVKTQQVCVNILATSPMKAVSDMTFSLDYLTQIPEFLWIYLAAGVRNSLLIRESLCSSGAICL